MALRQAAGAVAARLPPALVAAAARAAGRGAATQFGSFRRGDGSSVALLDGYRAHGKGRWRRYWWSTRALLTLDRRGQLPPEAAELVAALRAARELPAPAAAYAAAAHAIAEAHPDLLAPTGRSDRRLHVPVVAAPPRAEDVELLVRSYAAGAREILSTLVPLGLDLPRARILEVGCGRGYTTAAFAGEGAAEAVGVDLDVQADAVPEEMRRVREALAGGREPRVEDADLRALPYEDGSFDAVASLTVLEHVDDLPRAFAELRRVTAPGGLGYHGIDPWFGPAGGHSLCTLDFPWGHVRLDAEDFARYVRELRRHEADEAIEQHETAFQRPRRTLAETAAAARAAGFDVVAAWHTRLPLADPHRAWFGTDVLRDCRRLHPAVDAADLLALAATLVLRRR